MLVSEAAGRARQDSHNSNEMYPDIILRPEAEDGWFVKWIYYVTRGGRAKSTGVSPSLNLKLWWGLHRVCRLLAVPSLSLRLGREAHAADVCSPGFVTSLICRACSLGRSYYLYLWISCDKLVSQLFSVWVKPACFCAFANRNDG